MPDTPITPPWSTARSNIPWDEPGFSQRMLAEHLNQAHDAASRKFEAVELQVDWIHQTLLSGMPASILDLGCGPGLYTERLAKLGHTCHGIDFGPASIRHARATAECDELACSYDLDDLRTAPFGKGYDLIMFLYGEPSVFSPEQLRSILARAWSALQSGGRILLEPLTELGISAIGDEADGDHQLATGLFFDAPHRLASSTRFDAATGVASRRWVVDPLDTAASEEFLAWYQAYSDATLTDVLSECGFIRSRWNFTPTA